MPLSVAILAQTSLARESRTVAAMPRMPQKQLSLPASSVAAPAPAMAAPMEQSPRRPVEGAEPKTMTKKEIVGRIALRNNVSKRLVIRVLRAIASKMKEKLLTERTLRVAPFVHMKIETLPPIRGCQRIYKTGRIDTIKARPTKNIVRAFETPFFRNVVQRGQHELSRGAAHTPAQSRCLRCCSVAVPTQVRRGCVSADGSNALSRRFFIMVID